MPVGARVAGLCCTEQGPTPPRPRPRGARVPRVSLALPPDLGDSVCVSRRGPPRMPSSCRPRPQATGPQGHPGKGLPPAGLRLPRRLLPLPPACLVGAGLALPAPAACCLFPGPALAMVLTARSWGDTDGPAACPSPPFPWDPPCHSDGAGLASRAPGGCGTEMQPGRWGHCDRQPPDSSGRVSCEGDQGVWGDAAGRAGHDEHAHPASAVPRPRTRPPPTRPPRLRRPASPNTPAPPLPSGVPRPLP